MRRDAARSVPTLPRRPPRAGHRPSHAYLPASGNTHTRRPPPAAVHETPPSSGGDGRRFEAPPPQRAFAAAPAGVAAPESIGTCALIVSEEERPSVQDAKVWGRIRRPFTAQAGRSLIERSLKGRKVDKFAMAGSRKDPLGQLQLL